MDRQETWPGEGLKALPRSAGAFEERLKQLAAGMHEWFVDPKSLARGFKSLAEESEAALSERQSIEVLQKEGAKALQGPGLSNPRQALGALRARGGCPERQRRLAASVEEADANIQRLERLVVQERAAVYRLRPRLAWQESCDVLRAQLREAPNARLQGQLADTVRLAGHLSRVAGGLVELRREVLRQRCGWERLRWEVSQELASFQQLYRRRVQELLHGLQAWFRP